MLRPSNDRIYIDLSTLQLLVCSSRWRDNGAPALPAPPPSVEVQVGAGPGAANPTQLAARLWTAYGWDQALQGPRSREINTLRMAREGSGRGCRSSKILGRTGPRLLHHPGPGSGL